MQHTHKSELSVSKIVEILKPETTVSVRVLRRKLMPAITGSRRQRKGSFNEICAVLQKIGGDPVNVADLAASVGSVRTNPLGPKN